jgi:hypothetical protein
MDTSRQLLPSGTRTPRFCQNLISGYHILTWFCLCTVLVGLGSTTVTLYLFFLFLFLFFFFFFCPLTVSVCSFGLSFGLGSFLFFFLFFFFCPLTVSVCSFGLSFGLGSATGVAADFGDSAGVGGYCKENISSDSLKSLKSCEMD